MLIAAFTFALASNTFAPFGMMPRITTCFAYNARVNESPELHWTGAPANTQSYVLTALDVQKRKIGWVVYNIPPSTQEIPAHYFPGMYGFYSALNGWNSLRYFGPCPRISQTERYVFTLYALDTPKLDTGWYLPNYAKVMIAMRGHVLNRAYLTGFYKFSNH